MKEFKSDATTAAGFIRDICVDLTTAGALTGAKVGEMAFVGQEGKVIGGVVGGIMGLKAGIGLSLL